MFWPGWQLPFFTQPRCEGRNPSPLGMASFFPKACLTVSDRNMSEGISYLELTGHYVQFQTPEHLKRGCNAEGVG